MKVKPLRFRGNSLEALREFPADARQGAGFQLDRVQLQKKTEQTSEKDIRLARKRYNDLMKERRT